MILDKDSDLIFMTVVHVQAVSFTGGEGDAREPLPAPHVHRTNARDKSECWANKAYLKKVSLLGRYRA